MALLTVDDMLKQRASQIQSNPFLAYPASATGVTDFEHFSARDIDGLVNGAVQRLMNLGFHPTTLAKAPVVALLGLSNRDYVINMFALSRLGNALLLLSPRLSPEAYRLLLEQAECTTLLYDTMFTSTSKALQLPKTLPIIPRKDYDDPASTVDRFELSIDPSLALRRTAYILHSSGSTGVPKLIFQTHEACLENYRNSGNGKECLLTAPLYHTHGHATLYRELGKNGTVFLYNPSLPLTSINLLAIMKEIQPPVVYAVPYGLKLLAESQDGIHALAKCDLVSSSGSKCPEELGNTLVDAGVHLVSLFGSTETGQLMSSRRPRYSKVWDYMTLIPSVKPYIWMKPLDPTTYELVALNGLKSKVQSNSDKPPNSFHTRDIFTPHPTLPDAWKCIGRLDDRINLANGEKVRPLPIEGRIRQDPRVREAVVVGIDKDLPGLLVFRSEAARDLNDKDFLQQIWPVVKDANIRAERFSQISPEMVVPLDADVAYPQTDKGTIIRAQVYRTFAAEIEQLYRDNDHEGDLSLELPELELFIKALFERILDVQLQSASTDFFAAGLDSLKAIQVVNKLKKQLYLGGRGNKLTQNEVFQRGNATKLAKFILELRSGETKGPAEDSVDMMRDLVEKYSGFVKHQPCPIEIGTRAYAVVLTGVTGSLGSYILAQLITREDVSVVYGLVRASTAAEGLQRINAALSQRSLKIPQAAQNKIVALPSNLEKDDLGIEAQMYQRLLISTSTIIHTAWAVNFNLGLPSFEAQHIRGTLNLINFSLSVRRPVPARFLFCSSISTVLGQPNTSPIPEIVPEDLASAQNTGYGQSKLVAEIIVQNASRKSNAHVCILRIGQIVGDTVTGLWNTSEAVPLMLSTAESIGIPDLDDEECAWLPADTVAAVCVELAGISSSSSTTTGAARSPQLVYNVVHPRPFKWTPDLLPALRDAGMQFETVSPGTWVERLLSGDQDPERNPAIRLGGYFKDKYGRDGTVRQTGPRVRFSTDAAERDSTALRNAPDLIKEGLIGKFVQQWRKVWIEDTAGNT